MQKLAIRDQNAGLIDLLWNIRYEEYIKGHLLKYTLTIRKHSLVDWPTRGRYGVKFLSRDQENNFCLPRQLGFLQHVAQFPSGCRKFPYSFFGVGGGY